MDISILALITVFALIAVRKIGHFHIKIWQSMTGGAVIVLATGEISWLDAAKAIDLNAMLFLLGMFIVVRRWLPAAICITSPIIYLIG